MVSWMELVELGWLALMFFGVCVLCFGMANHGKG